MKIKLFIKKVWKNYISSNLDLKNERSEVTLQENSIYIYSFLGIIMLFINGTINLLIKNNTLTLLEAGLIIILIFNILYFKITKNSRVSGSVILINSIILVSILYFTGGINNTGILWVFFFPVIALFLKGKRTGFIWIVIYTFSLFIITLLHLFGSIRLPYSLIMVRQAFFSFIIIILFTYIYEDRKEKNELIMKKKLNTDPLTHLPNRFQLISDINKIDNPQLFLINIDNFKEINDFFGHPIGDFLLVEVAKKLKAILPENHFKIYRVHADEYSVLTKTELSENRLRELAVYLTTTITHKFFKIKENEITVNITIGIATGKKNILENSDMALKFAKKKKKNYMFFDKSMRLFKEYENNLLWVRRLKKAITENKVIPYFQPILNLKNKKIEKYECLARIVEKKGKIINPSLFIDIAKNAKLCTYITRMMIKKAVDVFRDNKLLFSINLSSEDILNKYTVAYIKKLIKGNDLGKRIIFEILESESIENYSEVSQFIKELKKFGCRIAIDDFGMGYSNFQHILQLNVDYLKIDSSLIMNIHKDKSAEAIVQSIVSFSKKLKIKTVAEFVYTKAVYLKVKSLKVDFVQGYYIGAPRPEL
ncbi:MAG: bifunctional diguanylate cyclase/phosphodiesterase [Spirochaetes bacterium]|nr:bifunctional diguanylate cyclase/phosphodiesterase [Spirochaetota bacterium]